MGQRVCSHHWGSVNFAFFAAKPFPSQGGVTRFQAVQRPEKKLHKLLDTS